MNFDWQMIAALALVLVAVLYLARLAWRTMHAKGGCGSCGSGGAGDCSPDPLGEKKTLVSIDLPDSPTKPAELSE
jgi:hypothetical protein